MKIIIADFQIAKYGGIVHTRRTMVKWGCNSQMIWVVLVRSGGKVGLANSNGEF